MWESMKRCIVDFPQGRKDLSLGWFLFADSCLVSHRTLQSAPPNNFHDTVFVISSFTPAIPIVADELDSTGTIVKQVPQLLLFFLIIFTIIMTLRVAAWLLVYHHLPHH